MEYPNYDRLDAVPHYSQRDNKHRSKSTGKLTRFVDCAPTSTADAVRYCLGLHDLDKTAIGCNPTMQLEDYMNEIIDSDEMGEWIKENSSWIGRWILKTVRRQAFHVEAEVFNRLMKDAGLGYRAKVDGKITYEKVQKSITRDKLPIVMSGYFKAVSRIGGHVVCCIGYSTLGIKELVCNDPFGSATLGYPKGQSFAKNRQDGHRVSYGLRFFKKKSGYMLGIRIENTG